MAPLRKYRYLCGYVSIYEACASPWDSEYILQSHSTGTKLVGSPQTYGMRCAHPSLLSRYSAKVLPHVY